VDGRLVNMSRDCIVYLKGLCLGFLSLFLFFGATLFSICFTGFLGFILWNNLLSWEAISRWSGICMFLFIGVYVGTMGMLLIWVCLPCKGCSIATIARVVKYTCLCINHWLGLVEGVSRQSLCAWYGLIAACLIILLLGWRLMIA
jgi:hypothetical protein